MKKRFYYLCFALFLCVTVLAKGQSDRKEEQKASPSIKLGAYYFGGWSGKCLGDDGTPETEWARGMPTHFTKMLATKYADREPVWGWREDSMEIMEKQIDLAASHGLSYFSFCWFWRDDKTLINTEGIKDDPRHVGLNLFMNAKNNNQMEFSLLVANHVKYEIIGEEAWKQAADYWIENYFCHPCFLKIDGKPVISIFQPKNADKEGLLYLQKAAKEAGYPGVIVAACKEGTVDDGFQALTEYAVVRHKNILSEIHYPFKLLADCNISKWYDYYNPQNMPYIPCITQGRDRRPWEYPNGEGLGEGREKFSPHFQRATAKEFEDYLRMLVHWMDTHPEQITKDRLSILYAWNENGEGGYIMPTKNDPDGIYLKVIKKVLLSKDKNK